MDVPVDREGYVWSRQVPFLASRRAVEHWHLTHGGNQQCMDVDVSYGKPIDMARVKRDWPFERELALCQERLDYFRREDRFVETSACPVCAAPSSAAKDAMIICGEVYVSCRRCSHVYARRFPDPVLVEAQYRDAVVDNPYYTNPDEVELRLREIYLPKLDWITGAYERAFGRKPETVLDLGAGPGHFLHGCQRRGLEPVGVEYSSCYRAWCKDRFDICLHPDSADVGECTFDIVTSFNVIEHTVSPVEFLQDCARFMHSSSLVIIETPRVNSLNTVLQRIYPDDPRGIVIPYEHNHLFTDASLATLLVTEGFMPTSVWYFGQDAAELILRMCRELGAECGEMLRALFPALQESVDSCHGSNLMMFASVLAEGEQQGHE